MAYFLCDYLPPEWVRPLKNIPKVKVQLANLNTPIQPWDLPGMPDGVSLSIKRDDMTGSSVTGTKIRKLEFFMADALIHNCKYVITIGGAQSNHCRAVAVSARRLGLTPHLIVFSDQQKSDRPNCDGNLLLHHLCGSVMYLEPTLTRNFNELYIKMEKLAAFNKETYGQDSYQIPLGGSNHLGMFGDINLFSELIEQGALHNYDDLVCASGTGGTAGGLAIANFLTGSKLRVHGISISKDARILHSKINKLIKACGIEANSENILNVIDCHVGQGYGQYSQDDIEFIKDVGKSTGVILDPVYTGKTVRGLMYELNHRPDMFKGKRILYLHTGGIFGLYNENIYTNLTTTTSSTLTATKEEDGENSTL